MPNSDQNIRWELLQKEIDLIADTVKNLDDIVYKMKNFAFLMWGGSLYLIAQHLNELEEQQAWLYLFTAVIPLLFWVIHYQWQKHLLNCSERQRIIAEFINHPDFEKLIIEEMKPEGREQFPFYDPLGCNYLKKKDEEVTHSEDRFAQHYLRDERKFSRRYIAFYKDAPYFYGIMISLSIVFGIFLFVINEFGKHN